MDTKLKGEGRKHHKLLMAGICQQKLAANGIRTHAHTNQRCTSRSWQSNYCAVQYARLSDDVSLWASRKKLTLNWWQTCTMHTLLFCRWKQPNSKQL